MLRALEQLKQKIDGTPDDEVNIPDTLRAIRTAAAYSPPNSAIHQLLRGTDPEKTERGLEPDPLLKSAWDRGEKPKLRRGLGKS